MKKKSLQDNGEHLPRWARIEIQKLSKQSGVSPEKLLMMSLRFGLYETRQELEPFINLVASAEALGAVEDVDSPASPEHTPPDAETRALPDSGPLGDVEFEHAPPDGDTPLSSDALERRDQSRASVPTNDFVTELDGE